MSDVLPPQRPPIHNEPVSNAESIQPEDMFTALVSLLSTALEFDAPWTVGGWTVSLLATRQAGCRDPFEADLRAVKDGEEVGVCLRVRVHPSGWIEARVTAGDAARTFFIQRVYEEFEIWPPGSPCTAIDSGRMGKRCRWVQLEARFWPELAFLAQGGFITLEPLQRNR